MPILNDLQDMIHDQGFDLSIEQIQEFVGRHPSWHENLIKYDVSYITNIEDFNDLFAQELLGRNWPSILQLKKDGGKKFFKELEIAAVAAGYKIVN